MRRPWAIALLLAVGTARLAGEDYLEPYRRGFNAFNLFRWEKTVEEMRKAIALNPRESIENVHIQLLTWKPYVPHFYLGISLAKLDRCSEAIPALRESLRQGMLQEGGTRFNFRNRAESTLAECLRKVPETPRTQVAVASPAPSPPADGPARESTPEPAPQAREPVRADPLPGPAGLSQTAAAKAPAAGATSDFPVAPAMAGPSKQAEEEARALAASRESLRVAVERARQVLLSVPKDATSPEASALRERVRRSNLNAATPDRLLSATSDITNATANVERWLRERTPAPGESPEPPAALVAGVDAYLRGDYAASVRILDGAEFDDERSRRHALLFRAAARHALFLLGHGRDRSLQTRAAADLRGYRQLQPQPSLDPRVFSPRFVQFARETGL